MNDNEFHYADVRVSFLIGLVIGAIVTLIVVFL